MLKIYEFHWRAFNRFNQRQKGKSLAKSHDELEQRLLAKGYSNIHIQRNFILVRKPKSEQITQLINQLAMLLNASVPLKQSLVMVLENVHNIKLYLWLSEIIMLLEAGHAFSASLTKMNVYLTKQEIQLIQMGEQSGRLAIMLDNIAQVRNQSQKLANKVKKIMFYPAIILAVSISVLIGLLLFIVPQFEDLYRNKDQSLPFITQLLFQLSNFLQQYAFILFIGGLFSGIVSYFLAKKWLFWRTLRSRLLNHMPGFQQIIKDARIIFFSQNLALMLNAHIHLDATLKAFLSEHRQDPVLHQEILSILSLLKQGYKFSEGLNPTVFTSQVVQMMAIGEQSGNLAKMCMYISQLYQQKLDYQIDLFAQLLEPVLMVVIGIIVGTILIGIYLPIFDMGALV
ncbi:fimbrial protein [[Haemophilus] ducreyi]|uniref:Protein transport protein HofC-like protein n=2 Tax=Haemophilus ducreyi TaxID=730 RepID=Q7VM72_HAEDU|nr:type II secretion system F family protein [[Haemophilus] ducreyi]AAP95988.1 protein transport protein HofC-like protein [[Haemophilus] ducreyi 35000HP]AKO30985.1 fimbrial protein [[Haemophilus] ducreyi]AKO32427.1 fimbrial protein [[Haemophilus] ducreyi]AKO33877.1 fimbrial protein [[Haemophilus] ducreyi]AKO35325.1 fimbrial protein [[Haemophilus] ducreyi]